MFFVALTNCCRLHTLLISACASLATPYPFFNHFLVSITFIPSPQLHLPPEPGTPHFFLLTSSSLLLLVLPVDFTALPLFCILPLFILSSYSSLLPSTSSSLIYSFFSFLISFSNLYSFSEDKSILFPYPLLLFPQFSFCSRLHDN